MATKWGDRDSRRRDIVAAGRQRLTEAGYAALQMRDVARVAGISTATLYTYFANKEALFAMLYAERLDELSAEIGPACESVNDMEELFATVATAYLPVYQVFGRELNIWVLIAGESGMDPEAAIALAGSAGRLLGTLGTTVGRLAREQLDVPEDELGLVLPLAWSTITGLADHFTSVRQTLHPYTWDQLVRFTARTFIRGLSRTAADIRPGR
ncbi:TetR/AcrR family transcriptional regulator [Nocardia sp. NBC_01327]|uniref:TetR/AcrR family transcriptional regulator n=1 Tax=Nocardia sp. NBC_01327 TaxID=2903593 RepID=UPI002E152695|nr:TetR/AcrR family transcriptional regulator [Nocardia sp. NBC_01327]